MRHEAAGAFSRLETLDHDCLYICHDLSDAGIDLAEDKFETA